MFLVATANSDEFGPLKLMTEPPKIAYALWHEYDFGGNFHTDIHRIPWERVGFWSKDLNECDWMFFTGCDAMITNPTIKLESLIDDDSDFIFSVDCHGLQSDSWLMRNCPATRQFLNGVAGWEGMVANEQYAMALELSGEKVLANFISGLPYHGTTPKWGTSAPPQLVECLQGALNKSPVRCKIVPQRTLNAYPEKLYGGTGNEPWSWQPGDFVCHLPGKTLKERIEFFSSLNKTPLNVDVLSNGNT